jgi:hypothetical protein
VGVAEAAVADRPDPEFRSAVARLLHTDPQALAFTALAGGVSSDIWQVRHDGRSYCAKRALPRLKVASCWEAPVSRNTEEVRWLRTVRPWVGERVAEVVAADALAGIALLAWYDPRDWHNWKAELLAGVVRPECAEVLGTLLGTIAQRAAAAPELAAEFANDHLFDALRIDPFFRHITTRYPQLHALIETLTTHRSTLVHGDFSPKNVLVDAAGDVRVLDAECACWGNAGFDPGYLLAHLLLKHLHTGDPRLLAAASAFWQAYRGAVGTTFADLEPWVAQVVGGMLLARVDGKSPVEYLTSHQADEARRRGTTLLATPPAYVDHLLEHWG